MPNLPPRGAGTLSGGNSFRFFNTAHAYAYPGASKIENSIKLAPALRLGPLQSHPFIQKMGGLHGLASFGRLK